MQYLLTEEELNELKAPQVAKTHEGDLYKAILHAEDVEVRSVLTLGMPDEVIGLTVHSSQLPRELVARLKSRPDVRN